MRDDKLGIPLGIKDIDTIYWRTGLTSLCRAKSRIFEINECKELC